MISRLYSFAGLRQRLISTFFFALVSFSSVERVVASDAAQLDDYERLEELRDRFASLLQKFEATEDPAKRIVLMRMQITARSHTSLLHEMATRAVTDRDMASDPRLAVLLSEEPASIRSMLELHTTSIKLPTGDESAAQLAAIDANLKAMLSESGILFNSLMTNLSLSRDLGFDVVEEEKQLKRATRERAANASAYLALAIMDVEAMNERAKLLPGDVEVQSLYAVQTELVSTITNELRVVIQALKTLGLRTSIYDAQIIAATGSISSDLFSINVFMGLLDSWVEGTSRWLQINGGNLVFNFFLFIFIILASRLLSRWVQRGTETALRLSNMHMSTLLRRMLVSGASTSVYVIGVLVALSQVGISLGPLLTGLGIVLGVDAPGQRLGQRGLAHSGNVFDQNRPTGQQSHDHHIDAPTLSIDDTLQVLLQRL